MPEDRQETLTRQADFRLNSYNPETRTFSAVIATAAPVLRHDAQGPYLETLPAEAFDLSAQNLPVLDSHNTATVRAVLGRSLETFGGTFALSRKAIVNDDLGAFARWGEMMGRAAAETEAAQLMALLTANAGGGVKLDDGKNPLAQVESGRAPDDAHGNSPRLTKCSELCSNMCSKASATLPRACAERWKMPCVSATYGAFRGVECGGGDEPDIQPSLHKCLI